MKKFVKICLVIVLVCVGLMGCLLFIDDEEDYNSQEALNETESVDDTGNVEELDEPEDADKVYGQQEVEEIDEAEESNEPEESDEAEESNEAEEPNEPLEEEEATLEEVYPAGNGRNISFDTVDISGNPVSSDLINDAKIVMLNLWEPWCGPCVAEMPELNQLYEDYKDRGLLIIGAYSTFDMDSDAREIVNEFNISYPIIKVNKSINDIEQGYVPATYLLDHNGNLITEEPFAGANSYGGWESIIREYLE